MVTLCQLAYAEKLVERISMADCQPCATPMEEQLKASRLRWTRQTTRAAPADCATRLTRPDISFVVGYVSRFIEDLREDHWAAVKWLLRYVKGMTH